MPPPSRRSGLLCRVRRGPDPAGRHPLKKLLVIVPLVLATASVGLGCGGDDDNGSGATSTTSTATALTKQEFLKRGNHICEQGQKHINAAEQKLGDNPSQAEIDKFTTKTAIPTIQYEVAGVQGLAPPSGDEDQVDAITTAAQQALDKLKADPSLITASGKENPFAEANKLANQYGLTACGG